MMLADMGADVIRVDRAGQVYGGDPTNPPILPDNSILDFLVNIPIAAAVLVLIAIRLARRRR